MNNTVNTILGNLGSFWSRSVGDSGPVRSTLNATLSQFDQIVLDAAEAVAVVSRFEVPIYKTELWKKVEVKVSEITRYENQFKYSGEVSYNGQIVYGQSKEIGGYKVSLASVETVPGELRLIGGVVNRPVAPTVSLEPGDYSVSNGYITFTQDPTTLGFTNSSVFNPTTGEDEPTLIFWLYNSSADFNRVYNHFGYVVGLYSAQSSENYKTLVNAVFDSLIKGSNLESFKTAAACIFGVQVVGTDGEVVKTITTDPVTLELVINTDKSTYHMPVGSTASVEVDDIVYAGDSLINQFKVVEGDDLLTFDPDGFGVELYDPKYSGPIVFENIEVPLLTVSTDTKVRVEFSLGGEPSDIRLFWENVRTQEDASGVSLANRLSLDKITGEPLPNQLPESVNPAKLVIRRILRDNLVILKADQEVRSTITNTEFIPRLRDLLHPHTMLLFQLSAGGLLDTKVVTTAGPVDPDPEVDASTNLITLRVPDGTSDSYNLSSILNFAEISLVN